MQELSKTKKMTIAALLIAFYVVLMLSTQSFAFGQYQIRLATAIYALSAIFPFLVLPLGFANFLSNTLMGGLGPLDMIGGAVVGILTCSTIVWGKKKGFANFFIALAIIFIPGLIVPIWLSIILNIPYLILATGLLIGQIIPGIVGAVLVSALEKQGYIKMVLEKGRR
ncbi:MAG TPA: QueT transporter family protein [Candidatus Avacidaminococcus intestinavium]|uniref:QueT transporter family protein n=1 Tax=Candidatus Avacidaminococcus intestinavium TaxID=2840684 RepID=A0A9D1MPX5_9FIRM|nr:QueT transporter family protein [Candidatus Avacidaminococcus intestinavium]